MTNITLTVQPAPYKGATVNFVQLHIALDRKDKPACNAVCALVHGLTESLTHAQQMTILDMDYGQAEKAETLLLLAFAETWQGEVYLDGALRTFALACKALGDAGLLTWTAEDWTQQVTTFV